MDLPRRPPRSRSPLPRNRHQGSTALRSVVKLTEPLPHSTAHSPFDGMLLPSNNRAVTIDGSVCSMLTDFSFDPQALTCAGAFKGIKYNGSLLRDGNIIVWNDSDEWTRKTDKGSATTVHRMRITLPMITTKSRRDPSSCSSTSTIPESNVIYKIVNDQPQQATNVDTRNHKKASIPAHHERKCD